jgi:hypothetical protein
MKEMSLLLEREDVKESLKPGEELGRPWSGGGLAG